MEEVEYKVKQIKPNHADHISYYKEKWLNKMCERQVFIQPKYDGERMLMHFNNGKVYCTSRRISKKTGHYQELQDKLKKFVDLAKQLNLGYTVIDCECYGKNWSEAASVLHSLPERAEELQKTITMKCAVFDCLFYDGQDIRNKRYQERIAFANKIVAMLNNQDIHFVGLFGYEGLLFDFTCKQYWKPSEFQSMMQKAIDLGFEGIVVKPFDATYYDKGASLKVKKFETVDVVVYDFQQGTGKYADTVGALLVGYYDKESNSIKHVSKVNCGTDADRDYWLAWFKCINKDVPYKVLEVKCQEITDKSLRHPVYIRIRDDKSYDMCTRETIFK